jgi:SAM-dependent methyltransferase
MVSASWRTRAAKSSVCGYCEHAKAKSFWSSTDCMGLGYGAAAPFYAHTLSTVVSLLNPTSVFEFGCNAGRNLKLIAEKVPDGVPVAGVDINEKSIRYGIEHHGLDLHVGDETALRDYPDSRWDLVFTVSVLDHIPDCRETCRELRRIASRYVVLCEPCRPGVSGRIDLEGSKDGQAPVTPYSYYHDYYGIFDELSMMRLLDVSLPTNNRPLGRSYRLMVYGESEGDPNSTVAKVLPALLRLESTA